MLEIPFNKLFAGTAAKGYKCPACGQVDRRGCRPVSGGVFCAEYGRHDDPAQVLLPIPDPVHAQVTQDPQVLTAELTVRDAQAAYDEAAAGWEATLGKLARIRIGASTDNGEFDPASGGWRPSRKVRQMRRQETELSADVETLGERRQALGEQLVKARIAHQEATTAARERASGNRQPRANSRPQGHSVIPPG